MEDLERRLTGMGYRQVRSDAASWRVSRVKPAGPARSPSRARVTASNRMLRFWLDRLEDQDRAQPYLIRRVAG
jgi:hypothetical protein